MTPEVFISIAIGIAIGIAVFLFQLISAFFFFFSDDAGLHSAAAVAVAHKNALETYTPSATLKTKAVSPAPVTPYVSVFSPVMARMLSLSPYKYSPFHFLTTHLTAPLNQPAMSFNKPPLPRRSTSQTKTPSTHVSTRTEKPKPAAKPRLLARTDYNNVKPRVVATTDNNNPQPAKPRLLARTGNNNPQPPIKCFVVQKNYVKPKIRTSTKPQVPRLSATVSQFLQTRTPNAKQPKPHLVYGTDNKNTKSVNKHLVSEVTQTKLKIHTSTKPQIPRLSATVSQFLQTRTKVAPKGKPVNTPRVAESVTKPFIADNTKPKMLPSRKPPRPVAPVSQAKPAKKAPSVDGTDKNYTKSKTKPFIAAGNNTKPRPVAVETDNGTKPKGLISTKPPSKGCIQRWR